MSNEIPALALLESLVLLTAIGKNDREKWRKKKKFWSTNDCDLLRILRWSLNRVCKTKMLTNLVAKGTYKSYDTLSHSKKNRRLTQKIHCTYETNFHLKLQSFAKKSNTLLTWQNSAEFSHTLVLRHPRRHGKSSNTTKSLRLVPVEIPVNRREGFASISLLVQQCR